MQRVEFTSTKGAHIHGKYDGQHLQFETPADETRMKYVLLQSVKSFVLVRKHAITPFRTLTVHEYNAFHNLLLFTDRYRTKTWREVAGGFMFRWPMIVELFPRSAESKQKHWKEKMEFLAQICKACNK